MVQVVGGGQLTPARMPNVGMRPVRRVAFADDRHGWLAGDGGLVLTTDDGGLAWSLPRGRIPTIALEQMEFRALAVRGPHCWMAGSPGSMVLHSHDAGATWQMSKTDHAAPLTALHFLDEQRGWAVGALGTILVTRDGGQTWLAQRRGGSRAALLAVYSQPSRVPLELVARLSGNEGYLSAVEVLQTEPALHGRAAASERLSAAMASVNGNFADSAWQFPQPAAELLLSPEQVIHLWNQACGGDATATLEAHLVRKIRQWRPDVIVTERAAPRDNDPLAHITNQLLLAAATKAGDPQAYPEQLSQLGLEAWKARKIFSTLPPDAPAMVNLSTAQLAPRLGSSLADAAAPARSLVQNDFQPGPQQWGFALIMSQVSRDLAVRDIFSGVNLTPGSDARRTLGETSNTSLEALRKQAQRARTVHELMARSAADQTSGGSWLGQLDDLTKGLSRAGAARTLYELGWRYHHSGQWASAAEAFGLVVDRYADDELADAAAVWLVQYYASGEAAARLRGGTKVVTADGGFKEQQATFAEKPDFDKQPEGARLGAIDARASLAMRAHLTGSSVSANATERAHRAIEIAKKLQESRPRLHARPELRFALAAAHRQVGLARQADVLWNPILQERPHDAWWSCAAAEAWLAKPVPQSPKVTATCKRIAEKPTLDGILDEEFWKAIPLLQLTSDGAPLPKAAVQIARDDEFLYLAIRCDKMRECDYLTSSDTRGHDEDLSLNDRIDLCLDLDRDYTTFNRFTIDYRGFTRDASLGDESWNPSWFVAADQDGDTWRVEAAIPLAELQARPPQPRDVWAIGISRTMPGEGFTSWNKPATPGVKPEGFGLLLFE
jgi:hypothetical protein